MSADIDVFPEIQARFSIRAPSLNLPFITAELQLEPTSLRTAGSRSVEPRIPRVDVWALDGPTRRTIDAAATLIELLERLEAVRDKLMNVRARYPDASFDLVLVVYVDGPEPMLPDMTFPHELLARMASIEARFVLSLYLTEPNR